MIWMSKILIKNFGIFFVILANLKNILVELKKLLKLKNTEI